MYYSSEKWDEWIEKHFKLIFIFFILLQILTFYFVVKHNFLSWDKTIWFNAVKDMAQTHQIPYITTDNFLLGVSEYPIFFTYFLLLFTPFIGFLGYTGFVTLFGAVQILCFIGITLLLLKLIQDKKRILLCFFIAPSIYILSTSRFDLMPAFFTLLAIYFLVEHKTKLSAVSIAIGTFLKIYTVMLIPAMFWKNKKKFFLILIIFLIAAAILNLLPLINHKNILQPFQNEKAGAYRPETWVSFLWSSGIKIHNADTINRVGLIVLLGAAFFLSRTFLGRFIALIIPLLITNKIFSPQWNLWFLSLLVLTNIKPIWIILFDLITVIEFPFIWNKVMNITSGFDTYYFSLHNPYCLAFVILNIARYAFFIYFYIKCVADKNLVNEKVIKREELE